MCKLNDFLILNGRKVGDLSGNFTSHQWNGSAVVDYVLTPNDFAKNISKFSVGKFVPWLSDHCPLHTTIVFNGVVSSNNNRKGKLNMLHPGFVWDEDAKLRYTNALQSKEVGDRIRKLVQTKNSKPINITIEIKDILMKNAEKCNLKKKKARSDKNTSAPWFDNECENVKREVRNIGNQLKLNPCDQNVRTKLYKQKRSFKNLIKSKKRQFKHNVLKQMTDKKNKDQKFFWKMLKKISPNKNFTTGGIDPNTFVDYFRNILTSKNPIDIPEDSNEIGPLDYNISLEELKKVSSILKPGKALGVDNISNEMIQGLLNCYPEVILLLFNSILELNEIIPEWIVGLIVPIYKKGEKSEPSNYRGITLMSCLGKLFIAILNNRLLQYTIYNKILSESQLGFLAGNKTSDAHIIMNNAIRKHCHKNGSKIYSCFIDFSKAFDTVPRDILFNKLLKHGVNGRFFNIIKNIYNNDKACIKIHSQCTETFEINQGVRQGCVLSPLSFLISF